MKHIIASLDLNLLAKKMIDEIKKQWVSPLLPPVVVFSDSKVEQWFKLRWISEKDSVLLCYSAYFLYRIYCARHIRSVSNYN